jgi:hypothetical protein
MQDAREETEKDNDNMRPSTYLNGFARSILIKMRDCSRTDLWTNDRQYLHTYKYFVLSNLPHQRHALYFEFSTAR